MIDALALFMAATTVPADDGVYRPSAQQQQVDRSFSEVAIETPLAELEGRLTKMVVDDCDQWGECEWHDAQGVRYYFWGEGPDDLWVVVKRIDAMDFAGRNIPALGIGPARERERVLAAARTFIPGAEFECTEWDDAGSEACSAFLEPGWVTMRFDASGLLAEVKLDGYHFT